MLPGEVCLTEDNMRELLGWINDTLEEKELEWMLSGNPYFEDIFPVLSNINERFMFAMVDKKKAKIAFQINLQTNSTTGHPGNHEKVDTAEEREQRKTSCDNNCHQY